MGAISRSRILPAILPLLLTACGPDSGTPMEPSTDATATAQPVEHRLSNPPPDQWVTHGRTYDEQRFSPLDRIDAGNVAELGLAWSYDTGESRGHEATPLIADGVMYLTAPWSRVYALDAATGAELWTYDPQVPKAWGRYACCDVVNRGLALWEGHLFLGTLDGRLVKIDAATGDPVWEVDTINSETEYTITGAPRVVKGKVIIGNGGAEYGVRGYVSAYHAGSGEMVWRFYTVPGNPSEPFEHPELEIAAGTWNGEWWKIGGGGTVWDSMAYDPALDLVYVGTGNGSPWSRTHRSPGGGDNLYLSSILALDPDDGRLVWHYQTTPGDNWDYTATQHMILADLTIDGRERRVIMQAPKNGFFYVLDRNTGELISARPYVDVSWASHVDLETGRPVETATADYDEQPRIITPTPAGGHNWHPMSYHPGTGLVYIPALRSAGAYGLDQDFEHQPGAWNTGTRLTPAQRAQLPTATPPSPFLLAWDPVNMRERWRVRHNDGPNGGVLSTAGNLVFQGTGDGRLVAYAADSGEPLWEARTRVGIMAPPVTYELDGEQHVTVVAGMGGGALRQAASLSHLENPGRVFTFKLGAGKPMPAVAERTTPDTPIPGPVGSPEQIAAGEALYQRYCRRCHGSRAQSNGLIRDLRYAPPDAHESWNAIVLDGAYGSLGMAGFGDLLDADEAQAIRSYVVARANATRRKPPVHRTPPE